MSLAPQTPLTLAQADRLAEKIRVALVNACARVEIAGSIRRRREQINDVEILAEPLWQPALFGQADPRGSLLDPCLEELVQEGRLGPPERNGPKAKRFPIPAAHGGAIKLDLSIIHDPHRWPLELAIRTGPADFAHALVTPRRFGGLLPDHCRVANGWRIVTADAPGGLDLTSEGAVIEFLCGRWIKPSDRDRWRQILDPPGR